MLNKMLICSYKSKEETRIHMSLIKQQFVLAHTIRQTEISANCRLMGDLLRIAKFTTLGH